MDEKKIAPKYLRILKEEIIYWSKRLSRKLIFQGIEGNISMRLGRRYILISKSRSDKGNLSLEDIVLANLDGEIVPGLDYPGQKISSEFSLHKKIYEKCPQSGAIVYGHPVFAIITSIINIPLDPLLLPKAAVYFGDIGICPFSMPGSIEYFNSILKLLPAKRAIILKNHGAITHAPELNQAGYFMEMLEKICSIHYHIYSNRGASTNSSDSSLSISRLSDEIIEKLKKKHIEFNEYLNESLFKENDL